MKTAQTLTQAIAPTPAHADSASQSAQKNHGFNRKVFEALMFSALAVSPLALTACGGRGNAIQSSNNASSVPVTPAVPLTLDQIAPSGIVMNTMVAAGQNATASITPSPAIASRIFAMYCRTNNGSNTRIFPDANGTYICDVQSFNQTISQNLGDNSVTFEAYEQDPSTNGLGTKTTLSQSFSVDAQGNITTGQPTIMNPFVVPPVATPTGTISSVPGVAGQQGFPSVDFPFTATDTNGVSCVQVVADNPSTIPPASSVSTWTQAPNAGFASSVSSSIPVAMPTGTSANQTVTLTWKVQDRLGQVTSQVVPVTTY